VEFNQNGDRAGTYDRDFLLSPSKRNQVMALWEVRQYGLDTFGDPDYVHLYGMPPAEWYRRGVRLLARTTVECVRDALGDLIGEEIERVLYPCSLETSFVVIDPFAGSCNCLYWILRHVQGARGIAFELDPTVFELTTRNIAPLQTPVELQQGDYQALLPAYRVAPGFRLVVFVAPPWGEALNMQTGLDLRRTQPPIPEVIDFFDSINGDIPVLYVIQVRQPLERGSLAELAGSFEWSELHLYDINSEGMKPGVLLGRRRWRP
jgi:hypothetical protein